LHPARALTGGEVRVATGVAAHLAPGSFAKDLSAARGTAGQRVDAATFAKGALVAAAVAPGLSPFVGARVGIGQGFEGGLTYTGRAVRGDVRRAIDRGRVSYSAGLGLTAALYGRPQSENDLPNVDLAAIHGYGVDVPLLVGWESAAGLYQVWGGIRGGFERNVIEPLTSEPKAVTLGFAPARLEANRYWGGGVVGLATGFHHVHVALELSVAYTAVNGSYAGTDASIGGVTLGPASAVWWSF
jgi:hypothetical protein